MEERKIVKERLDKELQELQFTKQADVLKKLQDNSWRTKLHRLWNKELSIPLLPVSSVFAIFLFAYGVFQINELTPQHEYRETIEIGGSMYYKDDVERRLADED